MSGTLSAITFSGVNSVSSTGYFGVMAIGSAITNGVHADGTGDLWVKEDAEVGGGLYVTDGISGDASWAVICPDNSANAFNIGTGNLTTISPYIRLVTTNAAERTRIMFHTLEMSAEGWENNGAGTGTVRQAECYKLALADGDALGGVLSVDNADLMNADAIVMDVVVDVTTVATAACTVDFGVDADGATGDDTLIDGLDVNSATGLFNNIDDKGANGGRGIAIASGEFLVGSMKTGAAAGLVGNVYVWLQPK